MKSWKRQWKDELDAVTRELRSDVKNEPINAPTNATVRKSSRYMIYAISSVCAIACIIAISLIIPIFSANPAPAADNSFVVCAVTLEINPGVTFITDKDGTVSTVVALNEDADVILSDSGRLSSLMGLPLSEALKVFVEYAAKSGYMQLDSPDAVRLSATGDCNEKWLSDSISAIENYFKEQNISSIVISETLEIGSFCERSGIKDIENKEELSSWAKKASSLLIERESSGLSDGEYTAAYKEIFIENIFKSELTASIEAYVGDVITLNQLNIGIISSSLKDYWSVKESGIPIFAPDKKEAERLVSEMDSAIVAFKDKYGTVVESSDELAEATSSLTNLLSEFLALWSTSIEDAIGMIEGNGIIINEKMRELIETNPTDEESFDKAAKEAYIIRFDSLLKSNEERYESERVSIDYSELKESLINEYGSLEAFFEEKNK